LWTEAESSLPKYFTASKGAVAPEFFSNVFGFVLNVRKIKSVETILDAADTECPRHGLESTL
jgi:hypothetical protein